MPTSEAYNTMWKTLCAAALIGAAYANDNSSLPTVDLGYEIYRASSFNSTGNFYNFSNIRYAQAPVGDLRFAPPKAPLENRASINEGQTSRICPQARPGWSQAAVGVVTSFVLGIDLPNTTYTPPGANASSPVPQADPRESEDCLFLDVFVPEDVLENAGKGKGAPVLVWIYGGGYTLGNKNTNPAGLLAASGQVSNGDIIYVALNYRLGALGWSAGPSFNAEGGTSNLGLYDQRFALEWIQDNIHLFGGDKDQVTVIGESAGGGSIMHQITAYGGLKGSAPFSKAIPQSPGWQPVQSNTWVENTYQKFLNLTNSTSLADLRALSSEEVILANAQQVLYDSVWGGFSYGPSVDGNFVPLQPGQLLAQGRYDQNVSVMVGHNVNEAASFIPPAKTEQDVRDFLRTANPYLPEQSLDEITEVLYPSVLDGSYGYRTQYERLNLIITEGVFTCNTYYLSSAFGNETYSYLFAVPPSLHGQDVAYTFYTGGGVSSDVRNTTVAIALQEFITSFAKTGEPEADGVMQFNMYGPDANVLKLNITSIDEVRDSNANNRCAWWQKALVS